MNFQRSTLVPSKNQFHSVEIRRRNQNLDITEIDGESFDDSRLKKNNMNAIAAEYCNAMRHQHNE